MYWTIDGCFSIIPVSFSPPTCLWNSYTYISASLGDPWAECVTEKWAWDLSKRKVWIFSVNSGTEALLLRVGGSEGQRSGTALVIFLLGRDTVQLASTHYNQGLTSLGLQPVSSSCPPNLSFSTSLCLEQPPRDNFLLLSIAQPHILCSTKSSLITLNS